MPAVRWRAILRDSTLPVPDAWPGPRNVRRAEASAGALWPLTQQSLHFDLGHILNALIADAVDPVGIGALGLFHAGLWECRLADHALVWSGGVYDIFGLGRGSTVSREDALTLYDEHSRAKLERLRSHAIRSRQGFVLDADIRPPGLGPLRRMRIIAAPVSDGDEVARLHGLKLAI